MMLVVSMSGSDNEVSCRVGETIYLGKREVVG